MELWVTLLGTAERGGTRVAGPWVLADLLTSEAAALLPQGSPGREALTCLVWHPGACSQLGTRAVNGLVRIPPWSPLKASSPHQRGHCLECRHPGTQNVSQCRGWSRGAVALRGHLWLAVT